MAELTARICVEVVYAPAPQHVLRESFELPQGSTLAQALCASQLASRPEVQEFLRQGHLPQTLCGLTAGIWGKKAGVQQVLRDHDRVELYRDLQVDPKVARRERFQKQGSKAAGLFARRRSGAKPGY